ncbi:MAG: zf-HC2 domain-containing protein [Thermoanaerobaculia bacterium]
MDHPSPDRWIAYHRGELSTDEEALLQEHLARCRDCFDLAAGAADFARPDDEAGTGQDVETAALWRLLRPQLDPPPQNVRQISQRQPSRGFRLPTLLAASFFVALVGMGAWNLQLQAPMPNPIIFDLSAGQRAISGEKTLSASTRVLVLHPEEELPAYQLTLRNLTAGRDLGPYDLKPDQDSALTLLLPEGLRPGRYRLELSNASGSRLLETHTLRVKPGPP